MSKIKKLLTLNHLRNFHEDGGIRKKFKNNLSLNKKSELTIITVVKNSVYDIEKTILSVIRQNISAVEYIIIDGNSGDGTKKILKKYEDKIDYWCSLDDKGIYDAINYALQLSTGKIIGVLNAGDIYTDNSLQKVIEYFDKYQNLSFLFGTVKRYYLGNNMILKSGFNRRRIRYNFDSATCHSSGLFLKYSVHEELGPYNTKYKCSSDYDLIFKLLNNEKFIGKSTNINEIIGIVASGGFSSKYGYWNKLFEETKIRIDNNQNLIWILIIFINSIIKQSIKFIKNKTI
jgi:glycosyltransferase involved in cell wall biosynthesis